MYSVITISDTCSAGTATDTSGPLLISLVKSTFKTDNVNYVLIPDEKELIKQSLIYACDTLKVRVVFTTGGTGFAPRDVTPEATREILTKEAPQLALAMALYSLQKTQFAVLSRAVCGVRNGTLVVNFPGSKKAAGECFEAIVDVLPHLLDHLNEGKLEQVRATHTEMQANNGSADRRSEHRHVCPHDTGKGGDDRNSPYPMIDASEALKLILGTIPSVSSIKTQLSRINIPPFRASIKDGYALKSFAGKGIRKVVGCISAGDAIVKEDFAADECYKINTGAPVPDHADAVVQVEDTVLRARVDGMEKMVEILTESMPSLDIRPIGSDLRVAEEVFQYHLPLDATQRALLAAIGEKVSVVKLKVAVLSTGDELLHPYDPRRPAEAVEDAGKEGKIYDSNTTMLVELLRQFGFTDDQCEIQQRVVKDDFDSLKREIESLTGKVHIIICTGGVSMGDKDFVKPVLKALAYELVFGRLNLKPGKPCVYASSQHTKFFGLPGNPVSAFVTFHLFALPALRHYHALLNETAPNAAKCSLPILFVELMDAKYELDPRPEYARAKIVSRNGKLLASITGGQISSRLKSTVEADALLELPAATKDRSYITAGTQLKAYILRSNFISRYE